MDFSKLDAALAGALAPPPEQLPVFVHVQEDEADLRMLRRLGVEAGSMAGGIATATLSPSQIEELSEQPWVRQIRLSGPLRLLGGPEGGPPDRIV